MVELQILKMQAIQEYGYLDKKTNIKFEDGDTSDVVQEVSRANNIKEVNRIRFAMVQNYCEALTDIIGVELDSFLLVDIKDYNDKLMQVGEEFDSIFLINRQPEEQDIKKARQLFDKFVGLYKQVQKNKNNWAKQDNKEFYGSILPKWLAIFSAAWLVIAGFIISKVEFSFWHFVWAIGGWIVVMLIVFVCLKHKLYKKATILSNSEN